MRKVVTAAVPLALLLVMAGLRIADLRTTREDALRAAEVRASNLAQITAAYLGESFSAADAVLRQLALHSRRVGGPTAPAAEWVDILTAARAGVSLGALTITDAQGIIRHSTRPEIVGQHRTEEPALREAMGAGGDRLVVGPPFPTIASTAAAARYIIPLTRPLFDASGTVVGTATASFLPAVAQPFLQSVDVGGGGTVWVFHPDGILLYQEPAPPGSTAGGRLASATHPVFVAARAQGAGVMRGPVADDGLPKVTAFHTARNPPVIVAVSLDEAAVLGTWRSEAIRAAVLFGFVSLLLVIVLVVLLREMAARAAALEREQKARLEAEQANTVKDQFLMTLSHELRTPLTAVRGWARMLALDAVDPERRRKAVAAIERNAQAQERLIEDLLDVSRVMGGKLPLNVRPVSIAEVAQAALDTVRPAADAKNLRLQSAIDIGAGAVSGDAERLQQVIWNLLANAVKFTPNGGRVTLEVRRAGSEAHILVSDTGVGISPRFLPHVFERFRQEDASTTREHGGLGLGLAIVRSLVEMHGGTVQAYSDGNGRGATFTVHLPLIPAAAAARGDLQPATTT